MLTNIMRNHRRIACLLTLVVTVGVWALPAQAASRLRVPADVCFWENLDWNQMTAAEQAAWRELGWTSAAWNSDNEALAPASYHKDWQELTGRERAAAQGFGYSAQTWDHGTCPDASDDD